MSNIEHTAASLASVVNEAAATGGVSFRQAKVISVSRTLTATTVTINLEDGGPNIAGVECTTDFTPVVDEGVWIAAMGGGRWLAIAGTGGQDKSWYSSWGQLSGGAAVGIGPHNAIGAGATVITGSSLVVTTVVGRRYEVHGQGQIQKAGGDYSGWIVHIFNAANVGLGRIGLVYPDAAVGAGYTHFNGCILYTGTGAMTFKLGLERYFGTTGTCNFNSIGSEGIWVKDIGPIL